MTWTRSVALALVLALAAGCGSKSGPGGAGAAQAPVLQEVANLLRAASADGRAPAKVADLAKYSNGSPTAYQAVKSGDIVVVWGAKMAGEGEGAKGGGEVIAYEKDAPATGGYVLLTSGEVKQMSADEFKAAPKAK
jgi:hypothetical protein